MPSQPFNLSPVELNLVYITFGAGRPLTYAETGMEVSALFGHSVRERHFWPRFLKACGKGLVSFESWDDMGAHRLARRVVAMPYSVEMIRDVQIAQGGDYDYYRYFDPYENYEKNPHKMDRFLKGPVKDQNTGKKMGRKKLFEAQYKAHKKDPKNFRWF